MSPSWYLTNSRIYRRGRLLPPLCIVLLSSIFVFFQNQRWRTQTLSQLSVRSHEKYSVGDGKYSANRGELEIIPYQEGLYQFGGWEVVWVIHLEKNSSKELRNIRKHWISLVIVSSSFINGSMYWVFTTNWGQKQLIWVNLKRVVFHEEPFLSLFLKKYNLRCGVKSWLLKNRIKFKIILK